MLRGHLMWSHEQQVGLASTEDGDDESITRAAASSAATYGATHVGRFVILDRIGAGGMGEVFAAYDEQLDRKVALKLVHSGSDWSPTSQARLLREARALARLAHPNVVAVFDSGIQDGRVFVAMEFVRGRTLHAWLGEAVRSWDEIVEVFIAAGQGLVAMHEIGLVHRDFKPSNVLIDERGRPRLIDFGLVGDLEQPEGTAVEPARRGPTGQLEGLTRAGAVLGTPQYMSPEQFEGSKVTAASDQFSFCLCLFEALYDSSPFVGDDGPRRALAVLEGKLVAPPADAEIVLASTGAAAFTLRSRWRASPRARRLIGFFFLVIATYTVQDFVGYLADRSLYHSVLGNVAFLTVLCFFAAPVVGPALRLCGALAAISTLLVVVDPSRFFAYFTAANLGAALIANFGSRRKWVASSLWPMESTDESSRASAARQPR